MSTVLPRLVFATAVIVSMAIPAAAHGAAPGPSTQSTVTWALAANDVASSYNVVSRTENGTATAVLANSSARVHGMSGYGIETLAVRTLGSPARVVHAVFDANIPAGGSATLDVRGKRSNGMWTEWRPAAGGSTDLGYPVSTVQARIVLRASTSGASPGVRAVRLTGDGTAPSETVRPRAGKSYTVFATREGLVGGTTANGHVIQDNDHFVALPNGSALASDGGNEYQVKVCNGDTCLTQPVWDIGPWNTKDNYWDANRDEFTDLPQGTPEAQAAYKDGYNNGQDETGRTVGNPAGIDLADGTFNDLGMGDNGDVTVTYLWTG